MTVKKANMPVLQNMSGNHQLLIKASAELFMSMFFSCPTSMWFVLEKIHSSYNVCSELISAEAPVFSYIKIYRDGNLMGNERVNEITQPGFNYYRACTS